MEQKERDIMSNCKRTVHDVMPRKISVLGENAKPPSSLKMFWLIIMTRKNTLEVHFVAWKRQETLSGMTVRGAALNQKIKELLL